ncbi:DUF2336 domain-containing protein [Phreatobacter stygius]|uniref:DUF2336 domain-containing protein n=1 Tax=Phreatobacter stygius TaxID=1940610 RepID=A0A4D7BA67_9HYPH|nr:DUF2336 domain-containing protein [Phreatobacter stygius]QCI64982.1 DUF2336 domain-containing protein [Phreatobacter stygius]
MTSNIAAALEPINAMIGELAPKLRGALVEELVDEIVRERPDAESRKALVLDLIVAQALREAPLSSRVRASPKLARCVAALPEASMALACDTVAVAEVILMAPDMSDTLLVGVCTAERQDHMRIIAKRQALSGPLADTIARIGESTTIAVLVRNQGARLSAEGFGDIVARLGSDPAIRSLLGQRTDCPADIAKKFKISQEEVLTGDALIDTVSKLAEKREILSAIDLIMRSIGRDAEAGRKLIERDDEKALGAVCHVAGVDAHTYEALVHGWRVAAGKPLTDVHKAPVRFRLMRPAEIDRIVSRLPMARARLVPDLTTA